MGTKVTTDTLLKMKQKGEKITALTAYDFPFAKIVDATGIDMILVGDSLGMVVQGKSSTLPVTMAEALYHTAMVSRACSRAMVIGDMPFMSYQCALDDAVANGGRFLKETEAAAVKLEGGEEVSDSISAIMDAGIPVMGHLGLTPQSVHKMGGFKVQRDEDRLLDDARKVQEAGAFSVVLEGIPSAIASKITAALDIPTIGIGAGPDCDGQILVLHDMIGISDKTPPKFVKKYAEVHAVAGEGIRQYMAEVKQGQFPSEAYEYK